MVSLKLTIDFFSSPPATVFPISVTGVFTGVQTSLYFKISWQRATIKMRTDYFQKYYSNYLEQFTYKKSTRGARVLVATDNLKHT